MDAVEVTTIVYVSPEEAFEFLLDFPGYARYSEHLESVEGFGDGGEGTEYELTFAWWKLSYTARSRVTDVDRPERIDWRLTKDLDAGGYWAVEPVDPPADESVATRIRFRAEFRPESANSGAISLPRLVSWDWVIDKVKPKIQSEAERVVRRAVRDLEGRDRMVDLEITARPDSV
ncbi:SRPBCC family protein [Halosegnis sp.]|uniref:SRPBCC family protein n=1 Tax=Halosegnis sp. TaxID=2864959 RepID=UPI0035D4D2D8